MADAVNHPPHYGGADDPYEAIKVIEAWRLSFHLGNAVKYISRAGRKDPSKLMEDLQKAKWYIERAIQQAGDSLQLTPVKAPRASIDLVVPEGTKCNGPKGGTNLFEPCGRPATHFIDLGGPRHDYGPRCEDCTT